MRFLTIFLISSLLLACGSPTSTEAPKSGASGIVAPETAAQNEGKLEEPMTSRGMETTETAVPEDASPMGAIRQDYARIEAALKAGTLHKDSISYDCAYGIGGLIDLYSDDNGIVLAFHESYQGDHGGSTEHYYFRDGAPIFLFRESASWQFGGEMRTLENGEEVPGTIDNFTEDRMYFHNGSTIKALTKAYVIRNGEDVDPSTIPNETMAHNGELPESLGFIQTVMATRKVDCKVLEEE